MTDFEDRVAEVAEAISDARQLAEYVADPEARRALNDVFADLECAETVENDADLKANLAAAREKCEALIGHLRGEVRRDAKALLRAITAQHDEI